MIIIIIITYFVQIFIFGDSFFNFIVYLLML